MHIEGTKSTDEAIPHLIHSEVNQVHALGYRLNVGAYNVSLPYSVQLQHAPQ